MLVTDSGIVMLARLVQPKKAPPLMLVRPVGITTAPLESGGNAQVASHPVMIRPPPCMI